MPRSPQTVAAPTPAIAGANEPSRRKVSRAGAMVTAVIRAPPLLDAPIMSSIRWDAGVKDQP